MSVGGKVTETIILPSRVWIDTRDRSGTACAIYTENTPEARAVSPGDSVWWQGGFAFWTAKDRRGKLVGKADTKIKRVGFSGVKRPEPIQAL